MPRRILTASTAVLLITSVCVPEASAIVFTRVDRDYTVTVGDHRFGVQDYSGWGFGSEFHGTSLFLGPIGKYPLRISARTALAVAFAALLAAGLLATLLFPSGTPKRSKTP